MKHAVAKSTVDMLHKIETIEKEVMDLKLSVLRKLTPSGKKVISLKGILKGVEITEQDINAAKKSLYSKARLQNINELRSRHTCPSLVVYRQPKNQFKSLRDFLKLENGDPQRNS